MSLSIEFDQVAALYDAQRAHPPAIAAQIGQAIAALVGSGRLLEIGVGTGRIALPASAAGAHLSGIDVSAGMLAVAAERAAAAGLPLALLRADAQQLPYTDNSFAAVLAVHVLHLLPDWRAGLSEIARVLQPGGCFLQGQDWRDPDSLVGLLRGRFRAVMMELVAGARPPGAGAAIGQAMSRLGGTTGEPLVLASWTRMISPNDVLAGMAARFDAETWVLPDDLLQAALEHVQAWAAERWPDLDAPHEVEQRFLLSVTRFP